MTTISVTEARDRLAVYVEQASAGDPVEITRCGRPVAVLVGSGDLRELREAASVQIQRLD